MYFIINFFFLKNTCYHLMNLPPCDFKLPGHRCPGSFYLLLSSAAEEFGLHDDELLWELLHPRNFVVTWSHHVNDKSSSSLIFDSIYPCLLTDHVSQFIKAGSWAEALVPF